MVCAQDPPPAAPAEAPAEAAGEANLQAAPEAAPAEPKAEISAAAWIRDQLPETLTSTAFLLENWQWVGLAILAVLGLFLDLIAVTIIGGATLRALKTRDLQVDEARLRKSLRPIGHLVMAVAWWVGLGVLGLPEGAFWVLGGAVKFLAVFAGMRAAFKLVDTAAAALEDRAARSASKFDDLLVPLVRKSSKVIVSAVGLVALAEAFNLSVSSILAGLGLGGLAFALAAQDTVKNFFGSLTVVLDRPFDVGDWVKIDDVEGTIMEVGFRSTRVRTFQNSVVSLPNAKLLTAVVDNFGAREFRRYSTRIGLAYDTPAAKLEAFCEGVRTLVKNSEKTRKDFYEVQVNELGAHSIEVLLYIFFVCDTWSQELAARHQLILDMLRLSEELGVEIAFPTQTLHVHQSTGDEASTKTSDADPLVWGKEVAGRLRPKQG